MPFGRCAGPFSGYRRRMRNAARGLQRFAARRRRNFLTLAEDRQNRHRDHRELPGERDQQA
jgi:hypothetical protein